MTITTTPRFGFKQYGAGTDPHPNRDEFNALLLLIENNAALFSQNVTASRPVAGKAGRYFWDTTVARLYYDDGAAWQEVTTNGGGGAGKPIVPNTAGVEGTSSRSARADHTHNLPLATSSADGAMPAADKALINGASATPTPSTLVKLDAAGRAQVAAPAAGGDIANKTYVDQQRDTRATTVHTHAATDVTSGVFAAARLPAVTTTVNGAMLFADKVMLDGATSAPTAGKLVERDVNGRAQFADPLGVADAVTKGWLDTQILTRAASSHTHSATDINSGTLAAARLPLATTAANGALSAADKAKLDNATAENTGFRLVYRDTAGRAQFTTPSVDADAANKSYVDDQVATRSLTTHTHSWASITSKPSIFATNWASIADIPSTMPSTWATVSGKPTTFAPSSHDHDASEIISGTLSVSRLPLATATAAGAIRASDQALLDTATYQPTGSALVQRHSSGSIQVVTGTSANDAANKAYVDSATALLETATGLARGAQGGTLVKRNGDETFEAAYPTYSQHVANKAYVDNNINGRLPISSWNLRIGGDTVHSSIKSPDGGTYVGCHDAGYVWSPAIYNTNATSGASSWRAMWVNSNGVLGYNLSSRKYKTDERDYEVPLNVLRAITPKRFKYISDVEQFGAAEAPDRVNFIAEDLFDEGLLEYVSFDDEGTARENVQTINEQLMVNALWSFAKQQQKQLDELREELEELKAGN